MVADPDEVRCIGVLASELTDSSTARRYDTQRSVLRLAWSSRCCGALVLHPTSIHTSSVSTLYIVLVVLVLVVYYGCTSACTYY